MDSNALCGPSNALQNFQKHAQVDRTLQQDRISNVHQPLESFRSSPGPSSGVLDADFEAFQAGPGPLFQPQPELFHFHAGPSQPAMMHAPQMPDWATDFQRLHVHTPSPPPQMMAPAPQQQNSMSGWHNEFMQEHAPALNASPQVQQNTFGQGFGMYGNSEMGMQGPSFYEQSAFGASNFMQPQQQQPQQSEQAMDMFDDAAFEAAFAAASVEVANQTDLSMDQHFSDPVEQFGPVQEFQPTVEEQNEIRPTDQDELARTAGRLLESVKDDESQKFQESTFLALMRRIRDREVTVEGDKMVETTPSPPPQQAYQPPMQEPWMESSWEQYSDARVF